LENINTPKIENMKNINISSIKTFINEGNENMIVYIIAESPLDLLANLIILVHLRILIILTIYGAIALIGVDPSSKIANKMSKIDDSTTIISILLLKVEKYVVPNAVIFKLASTTKINVKM
jgi:hypothetical protein